jgi:flavin reductase (DIM6/NTAB) family NADH-FMN oxidoreductase RutF
MDYEIVHYTAYFEEMAALLADPGLLLVSMGAEQKPNAMAIGWGSVGIIWGKPIFTVLVRPSRYTYKLMNQSDSFTVCVPSESQFDAVDFCGTKSGRNFDKFKECGLEALPSLRIKTPGIDGAPLIYECKIVHTNEVIPSHLTDEIRTKSYAAADYHRIYHGEILAVRALHDAATLLHGA